MLPTARELERLAQRTGFEAVSLEKVVRLAELLGIIDRDRELEASLHLKGGTALNLFFGAPKRLSVDLDFNFCGEESLPTAQARRPIVEQAISGIARSQGYDVQLSRSAHAGRKFYLGYSRMVDGQRDRIEIDVNFLSRVALLPAERRRIWRPDEDGTTATLVAWPEIAAGKLVAFLDRAAPRDAWDVARLPEIGPGAWPPAELRGLFIAVAGTLPRSLTAYGRSGLDRVSDADVTRLLHPLLIGGERPSAQDLRERSWATISPLLDLDPAEREYCERLQRGELVPELLFPQQPDLADRVRRYPPLLWKAQHAREHTRKTGRIP